MIRAILGLIVAAGLLIGAGAVQCATVPDLIRLESRFIGGGFFEYVLEFPDARYFDRVSFHSLHLMDGQGRVVARVQTPEHWTADSRGWTHDQTHWDVVPYRATFRVKANGNDFRTANALAVWEMHWYEWALPEPEQPGQVVAYVSLPCLVPCGPNETDGSSPEQIHSVPSRPEVRVDGLSISDNGVIDIDFQVGEGVPVVIEASDDLINWVPIGTSVGTAGTTQWTSAATPAPEGQFFRVVVKRSID
jgi:hypothetical protein